MRYDDKVRMASEAESSSSPRSNENTRSDGRSVAGQKSSEGGRGDPHKASPAAVERYLKGIKFPADKDTLVQHAKQNGAPSDVLSVLSRFEEKNYHSPIDVAKEVSNAGG